MKNVPEIRFPGFIDAWEQRKLGDVVSLRGRIGFRGYKETDLVPKGQGAITFSPSDIDEMGKVSNENNKYLSWEKYDESPEIQVQVGDILFTKTASIGKVGYVRELKEKATINPQFALLTPNETTNGYFTFLSVRNEDFMKQVRGITGGSSVPTMSQEKLKELVFMSPDIKEQEQIGSFFESIDNLITLHQSELESIQLIKLGLLQKMFPKNGQTIPEIRFPGFTDAWEKRKLGDLCERVQGNDGRMDLPTLTISAANGWMSQEDRFSGNIAGKEQKNYTLLHKGELSYNHGNSKLAKYGTVFSLETYEEALVPRVYHSFRVTNGNASFIEYCFATKIPDKELGKLVSSGARMDGLLNIGYDEFMGINIMIPSIQEQEEISAFLRSIDSLITIHQRELEKINELKHGLLQIMFV